MSLFKKIVFLPETQYGFQSGSSVSMALTVAQNDWANAKANNEVVGIIAFDFGAALEHSTFFSKVVSKMFN